MKLIIPNIYYTYCMKIMQYTLKIEGNVWYKNIFFISNTKIIEENKWWINIKQGIFKIIIFNAKKEK